MSGSASLGLEQAVLGHTLGYAAMPFPSQVFVALCAMAPAPSENTGGAEVSGGGYLRAAATFALADPPANIAANTISVEFPTATAAWGTVGFFELWDAPTGGHRLYWGTLLDPADNATPTTITVNAGDITRFSAGALAVMAATSVGSTITIGGYLPLTGGTLTGALTLAADPAAPLQAATRQYVDGRIGSGLNASTINVLDHGAYGDGIHDDTAAIQNTLNAYAVRATIFVPDTGHPYMINSLGLPSGTDLLLSGILKSQSNAPGHLINIYPTASNITIRGHGTIDGNRANQTGPVAGIYADTVTNLFISGITIQQCKVWPLNIVGSSHVRVDACNFLNSGDSVEFAAGCDDCWITGSVIKNIEDIALAFYGGVTNSGAIGNNVSGPDDVTVQGGISVLADVSQPAACSNIVIADNVIHHCTGSGIYCESTQGPIHDGITVANNQCHNNGTAGTGLQTDIGFQHCKNVVVTGNISANFGNSGTGGAYGLYAGTGVTGISFIGNHAYNVGQGTAIGIGLYVLSVNYLMASCNYFYQEASNATMATAIGGTAGLHNAYVGNYCDRPNAIALQPDTVAANVVAGAWTISGNNYSLSRNTSNGFWNFVDSGNTNLTVQTDGQIFARTHIQSIGGVVQGQAFYSGTHQVIGPQIAGWGTSTGGVRGAITASSTLPQVAAALAQLLTDLKSHGMIGA